MNMSFMIITCTALVLLIVWFTQWGGILFPASNASEDYYASKCSEGEQDQSLHAASLKFAENAKSERERGRSGSSKSPPLHGHQGIKEGAEA